MVRLVGFRSGHGESTPGVLDDLSCMFFLPVLWSVEADAVLFSSETRKTSAMCFSKTKESFIIRSPPLAGGPVDAREIDTCYVGRLGMLLRLG